MVIALGAGLCGPALPVVAQELPTVVNQSSANEINALTDKIIQKETEFLQLNVNLRLNELQKPWQGRFWFLTNLNNVSLTAVGAYINGFARFSDLPADRLARAPNSIFENAAWLRALANFGTMGGAIVETSGLALKGIRDHRHNVDLPTLRRYAMRLRKELDDLLAQRKAAIAASGMDENSGKLAESEGAVLADVADLTANEFTRYYADGKGSTAVNYLGYFISGTSNSIAAAGTLVGIIALQTKHGSARFRTRLGGAGGITDIIAGSMNTTLPFDLKYMGRFVYDRTFNKLARDLDLQERTTLNKLHADLSNYHNSLPTVSLANLREPALRDRIYAKQTSILDEHEALRLGDIPLAKRRFYSQVLFSSTIGPSKITNGIGTTVGAFQFDQNKHDRFVAVGGPAIAYGSGYCLGAAELLRDQIWFEKNEAKARRAGRSTKQVFTRELDELKQLGAAKSPPP
jgi:hypothetical protein